MILKAAAYHQVARQTAATSSAPRNISLNFESQNFIFQFYHNRINNVIRIIFKGFNSPVSCDTCLAHYKLNVFGFNAGIVNFL